MLDKMEKNGIIPPPPHSIDSDQWVIGNRSSHYPLYSCGEFNTPTLCVVTKGIKADCNHLVEHTVRNVERLCPDARVGVVDYSMIPVGNYKHQNVEASLSSLLQPIIYFDLPPPQNHALTKGRYDLLFRHDCLLQITHYQLFIV